MSLLAPDQLPPLPPAVVAAGVFGVGAATQPRDGGPQAEGARKRGLAALTAGRWTDASRELEVAVKDGRRWPDAYVALAWSYMRRGQPGMAFIPLQEGLKLAPGYQPGWRELSRCFYLSRRYDRAAAAGARATALGPTDPEAWLLRGLAESRGARPASALTSLARASQLAPYDGLAFRVRGEVLLGMSRPALAEPALKTALRLDPADEAAKRLLVDALRAQGKGGEALGVRALRAGEAP